MILSFLLILWMATTARAAGGGVFADKVWSRLPEILFALPISLAAWAISDSIWFGSFALAWSYFAMEIGHGNAYHMGFLEKDYPDRWQTLDYLVRPITKLLKLAPRSAGYCWVFMGLKGLLIGLPLGMPALILALLWPLAYYLSFKFTRSSEVAEWVSGIFAGLVIILALCTAHNGVLHATTT